MRKYVNTLLLIIFLSAVHGCGGGLENGENPVIAKINDFKMNIQDVKDYLNYSFYYAPQDLNDIETKKEIIDEMIQKELLLQEAQKQNLDKEKSFMKTIELYWEQTLIKNLIEKKSREIAATVEVTENEIQQYYNKIKETDPSLPNMMSMRKEIKDFLTSQKQTLALDEWVESLKKQADIQIDQELLNSLKFEKN